MGATRSTSSTTDMQGMSGMSSTPGMQALQNASGAEFNRLFVSQMLSMHEAKLAELQSASTQITDPQIKMAVNKAIPIIRMHRDMLQKMSTGTTGNGQ